jgi:lipopolysaccharide transport system ATP-binding protein
MAGSILGLSAERVDALFGAIVDFAEIGDYIDQPIRTYSSGMHVRLAFSVATAVRPDILIVDEALSVGDTYFQHKSFDRIRRFRDEGTTLLFVSHSPGAIKTLCNRALLLDRGLLLRDDAPDAVLDYYNALIAKLRADYEIHQSEALTGARTTRSGTASATIADIDLLQEGRSARAIRTGEPLVVRLRVEVRDPLPELTAGILIRDRLGNDVFGTNTFHVGAPHGAVNPGDVLAVDFAFPHFDIGVGSYSLTAALHSRDTHIVDNFDWWDRALVFQVVPGAKPTSVGIAALDVSAAWQDTASKPLRVAASTASG